MIQQYTRKKTKNFDQLSEKEADEICGEVIKVLKEAKITYGDAHSILYNTGIKLEEMSKYLHL